MKQTYFMNADANFDDADIILFGCPFDGTASYRKGARFGPASLREASYGLEDFSPYLNRSLEELKIHDAGDLEFPKDDPASVLEVISERAVSIVTAGKLPFAIGGEHLISLPVIRALFDKHPDLTLLHFDAHADLREDYLGDTLSHATVIKRVLDFLPGAQLRQFGIRSGTREEFQLAQKLGTLHKTNTQAAQQVRDDLGDKPVYISVDLDVFDPAYFPGTGTPEPGGIDFNTFSDMVKCWVYGMNIVGMDAVELAPQLDESGISSVLAAKVIREMLLLT